MEQTPLPKTYTEAIKELENIVRKMQSDECDIDNLSGYTARSLQLLKFCKERLQLTEGELQKLLAELG